MGQSTFTFNGAAPFVFDDKAANTGLETRNLFARALG